jgi:hypothetical protein
VHRYGSAPAVSATPYWPGWNIARSAEYTPSGGFYVLDGFGKVWTADGQHLDLFSVDTDGSAVSSWWEQGCGWQPWFGIQPASATFQPGQPVRQGVPKQSPDANAIPLGPYPREGDER